MKKKLYIILIFASFGCKNINSDKINLSSRETESVNIYGIDIPICNPVYKSVKGGNMPLGHNNLYSVPQGRKALLFTRMEASNSYYVSTQCYPEIKISGSYYRVGASITISPKQYTSTAAFIGCPLVLNYGDTLGVNVLFNPGLTLWYSIMEFDSISNLSSSIILSLSAGNNTLYSVPEEKSSLILGSGGAAYGYGNLGYVGIFNNSGSTQKYQIFDVPLSGTPDTLTNAITNNSNSISNLGFFSAYMPNMNPGDHIVIKASSGSLNQIAWVTYYELNN